MNSLFLINCSCKKRHRVDDPEGVLKCKQTTHLREYMRKRRAKEKIARLANSVENEELLEHSNSTQKIVDDAISSLAPRNFRKQTCTCCFRHVLERDFVKDALCTECAISQAKNELPTYSIENGLDFGKIPSELQELTVLEELLIARARIRHTIIKLKMGSIANGDLLQKAIRGNVIAFPQDVAKVQTLLMLPPSSNSIPEFVKVILTGSFTSNEKNKALLKYGKVRRQKVIRAIIWKQLNDPFYEDVVLDLQAANTLPVDGIPSDVWNTVAELPTDSPESSEDIESLPNDAHVVGAESVGYIDFSGIAISEQDLANSAYENAILRVPHSSQPISTFEDAFWSHAFPVLFPYGRGLPSTHREKQIGFRSWLRYCLSYHDRRFRTHPIFLFVAYNILKIKEVCQSVKLRCSGETAKELGELLKSVTPEMFLQMAKNMQQLPYSSLPDIDHSVKALLQKIQVTGAPILGSIHSKIHRRNELRAQMVRYGLPSIWLTLNPSELRNGALPMLAGLSEAVAKELNSQKVLELAAEDPVSVAELFDSLMDVVFRVVVKGGLFGKYVTHYGVVETQDRGSLHLHALVWMAGIPSPSELSRKMETDEVFRESFLKYRDSIISESIDETPEFIRSQVVNSFDYDNLLCFSDTSLPSFRHAAHYLASKSNMHKTTHTWTCRKFGKTSCRFKFPRPLVSQTIWDTEGKCIRGQRNNQWINSFNEVLMYLLRSNHDVQLLCSAVDSMALIYYVTDYATKSQLKSYEVFNLIAAALEKTKIAVGNDIQSRTCEEVSRLALLKCINTIGAAQEISAPLCALHVMYEKEVYTPESFVNIKWMSILSWYQNHYNKESHAQNGIHWDDDDVLIQDGVNASFSNLRMDYLYRGGENRLSDMNLYIYASCVYKRSFTNSLKSTGENKCHFLPLHAQALTHVQFIRRSNAPCAVLLGKSLPNPNTDYENYCEAMLLLFKPWDLNTPLRKRDEQWSRAFENFLASSSQDTGNPYFERYTIPPLKTLIHNLENLRKTKESAEVARARATYTSMTQDGVASEILHSEFTDYDDSDMTVENIEDFIGNEEELTLFQLRELSESSSFSLANESFAVSGFEKIACLIAPIKMQGTPNITERPRTELTNSTNAVALWTAIQKTAESVQEIEDDIESLSRSVSASTARFYSIDESILQALDPQVLVHKIVRKRKLNKEQKRAFAIIAEHEFVEDSQQLLMYVGGSAGTGKSEIIKACGEYFALRIMSQGLKLSASTGTAARKFKGSTIHSLCKFSRSGNTTSRHTKQSMLLSALWAPVRYLVIDEVSMMSASLLADVSASLQRAKGNEKPFGGINVILFGDFFQFPPVSGFPLYGKPAFGRPRTEQQVSTLLGLNLWSQFNTVVLLLQNFRQEKDSRYLMILERHLKGALTADDISLLKSRVLSANLLPPPKTSVIVNRNSLRTMINNHFVTAISAVLHEQVHTITAVDSCSNPGLNLSDEVTRSSLLHMDDNKTDNLPGVLKIFKGMKCMVTANIDTSGGLSNGTIGEIFDWSEEFSANGLPTFILLRLDSDDVRKYDNLPEGIVPVFPQTGSFKVTLDNKQKSTITIRRKQFPIIPAYAITDYKSQGDTLHNALIDIRKPPIGKWASFFALYVLLSRVSTLDGLYILHSFEESVFYQKPPVEILELMQKLEKLDKDTTERINVSWADE